MYVSSINMVFSQCDEYYINELISGVDDKCYFPEGSPVRFCPRLKGIAINGTTFDVMQWDGISTQYLTLTKNGGIAGTVVLKLKEKELLVNLNGCGGARTYSFSSTKSEYEQWIKSKPERDKEKEDELLKSLEKEKVKLENIKNSILNDPNFLKRIYCSAGGTDSIIYFDLIQLGQMNWSEAFDYCNKIGNEFRLPTEGELQLIAKSEDGRNYFNDLNPRIFWISKNEKACVYETYMNSNGVFDKWVRETDFYEGKDALVILIRTEPLKRFTVNETNKTFEVMTKDIVMPWTEFAPNYHSVYRESIKNLSSDGWRTPHIDELRVLLANNVDFNDVYWYAYSSYQKGQPDSYFNTKSRKTRTSFSNEVKIGLRLVREIN
jgi:hypothetical protein